AAGRARRRARQPRAGSVRSDRTRARDRPARQPAGRLSPGLFGSAPLGLPNRSFSVRNPPMTGSYPAVRLRRARTHAWSRAMVAEAVLTPADLIWPLFVTEGTGEEQPVASLPGVSR